MEPSTPPQVHPRSSSPCLTFPKYPVAYPAASRRVAKVSGLPVLVPATDAFTCMHWFPLVSSNDEVRMLWK